MANEIYQCHDNNAVLYALIWRASDAYIYNADAAAFEASEGELVYFEGDVLTWEGLVVTIGDWGTQLLECDIPLTAYGFTHLADFPAVAAGSYIVEIRKRSGTAPAYDDINIGQGFMEWDGSTEILLANLNTTLNTVSSNLTSAISQIVVIDGIVDNILLALNKSYNVYPAPTPEQYNPLGKL